MFEIKLVRWWIFLGLNFGRRWNLRIKLLERWDFFLIFKEVVEGLRIVFYSFKGVGNKSWGLGFIKVGVFWVEIISKLIFVSFEV